MKVELIFNSPLILAIRGARKCYDSMSKSDSWPCFNCGGLGGFNGSDIKCSWCHGDGYGYGEKDIKLLKRLIKDGHTSVIEHVVYTWEIDGVSRALSHQLVRHRIASYSQQSQRYVKLDEQSFPFVVPESIESKPDALKLYTECLDKIKDTYFELLELGVPKEDARMLLPNATKTTLIVTFNARSLRNFFNERLSKKAQWEIRELAMNMYDVLPEPHKILFEDIYQKHVDNKEKA